MFLEGDGVSPKVGQRRRRGEGNSREDRRSRIKNGRVLSLLCSDSEIGSEIDLENESEGDSEGVTQMLCSKAVDAEVIPSMDDEGSSGDDGCSSDTDAGSSEESERLGRRGRGGWIRWLESEVERLRKYMREE